jgi:hypothetical protein
MTARTPATISAQVQDLCRQINPNAQAVYLSINPEPGCEPNDCFGCVKQKVAT